MRRQVIFAVTASLLLAVAGTARASGDAAAPSPAHAAERYAERAAAADPSLAEPLVGVGTDDVWACASCHGDAGEGNGTIPRLAGLPAGYIVKQLKDYAAGARESDNMEYVVAGVDDAEMAALGRYYAGLDTPSAAAPSLGGDLDRGRELAVEGDWELGVPACFACHGSSGWGGWIRPSRRWRRSNPPISTASSPPRWTAGARTR